MQKWLVQLMFFKFVLLLCRSGWFFDTRFVSVHIPEFQPHICLYQSFSLISVQHVFWSVSLHVCVCVCMCPYIYRNFFHLKRSLLLLFCKMCKKLMLHISFTWKSKELDKFDYVFVLFYSFDHSQRWLPHVGDWLPKWLCTPDDEIAEANSSPMLSLRCWCNGRQKKKPLMQIAAQQPEFSYLWDCKENKSQQLQVDTPEFSHLLENMDHKVSDHDITRELLTKCWAHWKRGSQSVRPYHLHVAHKVFCPIITLSTVMSWHDYPLTSSASWRWAYISVR